MANKVSSECSTTQADDLPGNHHNPKTPTTQVPTDENAASDIGDDKEEDGGPPLVKLTKKCRQQTAYDKKDEKHFLRTLTNISDNFYYTDEDSLRRNGLPTLPSNGSASSTDIEGWKDGVEEVTRGGSSGGKRGKVGGSGSFRKPRSKGEHRKIGNENFKFEFYNDPRRYLKQYKRFHSCTGQATKLRQNEAIPLDYPDMSYNVWDRPEATFPLKLDAITREGGSVLMKVGRGNLITAPLVSASNVLVLQQRIQPPPSPQHNDQNSKSLENKKSKEQKLLLGPPFPHRISARSSSPTTPHSLTELLKGQHNSTDGVVSSNSLPPQAKQNQYIKKRQPAGHKARAKSSKNEQQQLNYNHPPTFAIMSAKLSSKYHQYPWLVKELLPQKQQTDKATVDKRPKTTTTTGKDEETASLKHNDYTVARMLLNWRRTYETTLKNNRSLTKPRASTAQCSDAAGLERNYVSKSAMGGGRPVVASNVSMYDTNTTRNGQGGGGGDCMKARPITHIGFRSRSCCFRQLNKMKSH